jgi:uncharacterized repeat protein (TIGR01451 family)
MMHRIIAVAVAACFAAVCLNVNAAGTPAGTSIANQAEVTFTMDGATLSERSNLAVLRIAEVLDVTLLLQTPERLVAPGDTMQALPFTLTNTGNGAESFRLSASTAVTGDEFDPVPGNPSIFFDTDGNGALGSADVAYVSGGNDPMLLPDESIDLFFIADIPPVALDGQRGSVEFTVRALTGSGAPGVLFTGAGEGGVDALTGVGGAVASAEANYVVERVALVLAKTATVVGVEGGDQPMPGASIVYTIQVSAVGSGTATNAVIVDPIPSDTTYAAGSLRLNGSPLSDLADSDAGSYVAATSEVRFEIGSLGAQDVAQQVQFTVRIN